MATALERNNVRVSGRDGDAPTLVFVHGFGCNQEMWRLVAPQFTDDYRVVLYDLTGAGGSDIAAYDFKRHAELDGHADDLIDIISALDLRDVTVIGHSVGAMIALIAANRAPDRIARLGLVSPSPSFENHSGYHGGFERADLEGLIAFMDENYLGWSQTLAPTITGQPEEDDSTSELTTSFCRTDPDIARHFGKATFLADRRADVAEARHDALIIQCADDALAPVVVGQWMHDRMPGSRLKILSVSGHCPHLTAPELTGAALKEFLNGA